MKIKYFSLSGGDIKTQFRVLSKKFHPDSSGFNSNDQFSEMKSEYDYLVKKNKTAYTSFVTKVKYPNISRYPGIDFENKIVTISAYRADGTKTRYKVEKLSTELIDQIVNYAILHEKDVDWVVSKIMYIVPNLNSILLNYIVMNTGVNKQIIIKIIKRYR